MSGEGVSVVEPAGFREFVMTRSPALLRTGLLMTGQEATAKDLVHSALLKTWSRWEGITSGAEDAYVRRVMVSTFLGGDGAAGMARLPSRSCPSGRAPSSCCATSTTSRRPLPRTP